MSQDFHDQPNGTRDVYHWSTYWLREARNAPTLARDPGDVVPSPGDLEGFLPCNVVSTKALLSIVFKHLQPSLRRVVPTVKQKCLRLKQQIETQSLTTRLTHKPFSKSILK